MKKLIAFSFAIVICMMAMAQTEKPYKWNDKLIEKADKGDKEAAFNVGYGYLKGPDNDLCPESPLPTDIDAALKYLTISAEKGHPSACNVIGNIYYQGLGVQKDVAVAAKWFGEAAKGKHPDGMCNSAYLTYEGVAMLAQMGQAVDPAALKGVVMLTEMAAKAGSARAAYNLGVWYATGDCMLKVDPKKCVSYMEQAANLGFAEAYANMANLSMTGQMGVKQDFKKAREYAEKGIAAKNAAHISVCL